MAHVVDIALMRKIKKYGAGGTLDVSACFNCGNCTAVCPLAEDSTGFPRRIIRMAQVGMEAELLANEDLWRCYACGECTETCPRQADPAQFMAAARGYAISRYDVTGIARWMYRSAAANIAMFVAFSAFFTLLLLSHHVTPGGRPLELFEFIPGVWVHDIGVALFAAIGLAAAMGVVSMVWRVMNRERPGGRPAFPIAALPSALWYAAMDALNHGRFRNCGADQLTADQPSVEAPVYLRPWFVHGSILWGFLAMLVATTLDYMLKPIGSPVPPWYPMRILGLLGGLACLYGLAIAIARRVQAKEVPYDRTSFSDWFFLLLLAATVLTGMMTELVVYLPRPTAAGYTVFLTHIVLAMDLVAMLPLTKFAHAVYRTLALALNRWAQAPAVDEAEAAVAGQS